MIRYAANMKRFTAIITALILALFFTGCKALPDMLGISGDGQAYAKYTGDDSTPAGKPSGPADIDKTTVPGLNTTEPKVTGSPSAAAGKTSGTTTARTKSVSPAQTPAMTTAKAPATSSKPAGTPAITSVPFDNTAVVHTESPGQGSTGSTPPVILQPPAEYQELYDIMLNSFRNVKMDIDLTSFFTKHKMNQSDADGLILQSFNYVINYNPEIFFLGGYNYQYSLRNGYISNVILHTNFTEKYTAGQATSLMQQLNDKVDAIVKEVGSKNLTPFGKELWVHDYLIRNIVYDTQLRGTSHSAVSALLYGTAVCDGYARSFQMIMNRLGIETRVLAGDAGSPAQKHMWNIIKLNNKYYHIDVTFDDPIPDRGADKPVFHTYFNQTDEFMKNSHSWNPSDAPVMNSSEMNYYYVKKLIASDMSSYKAILSKIKSEQQGIAENLRLAEIMFTGAAPAQSDVLKATSEILNRGYSYSPVENNIFKVYVWH